MGSGIRSSRWGAIVALAVAALIALPQAAGAEPFNMMPVPPEVPEFIDGTLPAAPVPKLDTIPERAADPDHPHEIQELRAALLPDPSGDPFFDRWPDGLAAKQPGTVLAVRDVTGTAGLLVTAPIREAVQLKFVSTDAAGRPSYGTATVITPAQAWTGDGPRPIVVNNLPIDSLGAACTPGMTLAHGLSIATGVTDFIPPTTQLALARGYTVVIPDHQGPRMAYAEPTTAGHIILDSLRAAAAHDPAAFGSSPIGLQGYSGGAIATNGAVKLAGDYAPDVADRIVGAVLGGVPADFRMLVGSMNANLATGIFHAATLGIARERTEVLPMANRLGQWLATSPLKNVCLLPAALAGGTFFPMQLLSSDPDPFHSPAAEQIYAATKLADRKSVVPLYIYNGTHEWWIPAEGARNLYREQCRHGATAVYREVFGEHLLAAVLGYPESLAWLDDRLQGQPAVSECPRR